MKKILLSVLVLCCTVMAVNSQVFLGSSLGFDYSQRSNDGTKLGHEIGFGIAPEVGYSLNNRWDIGIAVGFGIDNEKIEVISNPADILGTSKTMEWGVAPFARYSFFQFGRFEILGRAQLYVANTIDKQKPLNGSEVTLSNSMSFGLNISPMLLFNLNDRISIHTQLNFFGLNIDYTTEKESKNDRFSAGLLANSNNLFNVGALTFGFTYNF